MTVNDFIKSINGKSLDTRYLFSGSDYYLTSILVKGLIKVLNIDNPDFNITRFEDQTFDFDKIYESIQTLPVFADKKLTIVDLTNAKKKDILHLDTLTNNIDSIPSDSYIVIIVGTNTVDGLDKNKFTVVDTSSADDSFLLNRISLVVTKGAGKSIDKTAATMLIEYSNRDLGKITTEAKKLVAYVGDNPVITVQDVKDIVEKTLDFQIYELTNALGKKDAMTTYTIINSMKEKKGEFQGVVALIYNYFRRLLHVSLAKGKDMSALAQDLGVKEGAIKFAITQEKMFGAMKLKNICDLCMKYDYETKRTMTTIDNAVETIILTILNM